MPSTTASKANLEKARAKLQEMIASSKDKKADDGIYHADEEPEETKAAEEKPAKTKAAPKAAPRAPKPKPKAPKPAPEEDSESDSNSEDDSSSDEEEGRPSSKKPRRGEKSPASRLPPKRKAPSKIEERKKAMQESLAQMIREEMGKFQKQTQQTLKHQLASHNTDLALSRVHIVT